MAFYSYGGGDECDWSPYTGGGSYSHDYGAASEFSSPIEVGEHNLIGYTYCEGDYSVSPYSQPISNTFPSDYSGYCEGDYSVSSYSQPVSHTFSYDYSGYGVNEPETDYGEPKYLRYDPVPHYVGYFPSETKFTVSYSQAECTEPEFDEYDPTPYDGGYDQTLTYGKPLTPSDLTCYPRSLPQSDAVPLENFDFNSIPSPYGKDDPLPVKPSTGSKSPDPKTDREVDSGKDVAIVEPIGDYSSSEDENVLESGGGSGDYSSSSSEDEKVLESGGGGGGGGDFESVSQIPYGSGLEAMDICDGLFGYWPCLEKKAREQRMIQCQNCVQVRRKDPWETAADYIFGSVVPYDYDNHHHQSPYQSSSWLQ